MVLTEDTVEEKSQCHAYPYAGGLLEYMKWLDADKIQDPEGQRYDGSNNMVHHGGESFGTDNLQIQIEGAGGAQTCDTILTGHPTSKCPKRTNTRKNGAGAKMASTSLLSVVLKGKNISSFSANCLQRKMLRTALFVLSIFQYFVLSACGPVFSILLPPKMKMANAVEYRLHIHHGCFNWSWDDHDVITVFPLYEAGKNCSASAILKSIAPYTARKETIVYATELRTGIETLCRVYIDKPSRIQIAHTSFKLRRGELTALKIRAFDDEGMVFSSLMGLPFVWQQLRQCLVHVPLRDSLKFGGSRSTLDVGVELEDQGYFSDTYVVRGIDVGYENVSAYLFDPSCENIRDEIIMTVVEAITIDPPSPVFVLPGAQFHFNVTVQNGSDSMALSMPDKFLRWHSADTLIAFVFWSLGGIKAINLGVTTINIWDKRLKAYVDTLYVHVVLPRALFLDVKPISHALGLPQDTYIGIGSMRRWYVVSGRSYMIELKVFTYGYAKQIFLTEKDDIKFYQYPSEHWNLLIVTKTTRRLEAISPGLGKLKVTLAYNTSKEGECKEVVEVIHEEVMVCDEVRIIIGQSVVGLERLLLHYTHDVHQEVEFGVTGGCAVTSNDYKWFSSDSAVVSVSDVGIIRSESTGMTTIKVVSLYDSSNYDEIAVEVVPPISMSMLQNFPLEVLVGSHLRSALVGSNLQSSGGSFFRSVDCFIFFVISQIERKSFTIVNVTGDSLLLVELRKVWM